VVEAGYRTPVTGVPEGYRTLSPHLLAEDGEALLAFVCEVFGTSVRRRTTGEAGALHAEVEIGDSVLMVGEGGGMSFPAMLHAYVEGSDAVYERALAAGARSVAQPHEHEFRRPPLGIRRPLGQPVVGRNACPRVTFEDPPAAARIPGICGYTPRSP
jgi:PhnB protein